MSTSSRPQVRRGVSGGWNRLKPTPSDPLDAYTLPSKGETRLHDHKNQESYHQKIVERYMKFCASSGPENSLEDAFKSLDIHEQPHFSTSGHVTIEHVAARRPPLAHRASETERPSDLHNILLAMRKLREGIFGSRRRDRFAQRAYMFIIHASILSRSWESYQPALLYLLYQIHPHTPLSSPELQEYASYQILDLACRQYNLTDALATKLALKNRDRRVSAALHSLVHDDWVRFWRVKRAVDGYQRAIMEFAVEKMQLHALKCLGKSYHQIDKAYAERSGDADWKQLVQAGVGWQLQDNGIVLIRKLKAKT